MRLQLALLVAFNIAGAADDKLRLVRETDALTPEQEQTKLHAPDGFTVQLFASEPMINKPINMAFDARGRLWVSSTVEYPYAAAKDRWSDAQGSHVKDSRDAIKILEDTDGDGKADKVTDFADGLNIPTGVLPWHKPEHKAGCIAWSIPNIWYFADTDGDGKCDKREVLFGPLGYEKDTHGMCSSFRLGLDGWVYATHGFNNTSHLKAKDGSTLDLHSGNVFRFRPDGSHVEIWSWGQVNPFGLCWDRYNNLYSADCHSNPITQLIRGAYYPSFGKPHDGLGYGPVMCEHSHGSTGLCGIIYIDGGVWGKEWDDHMFLGNCVTSKVNHDKITFAGSTPKANEQPDFITSDDPWFRPVDLQLGPDNALYIADFYNKIIGHYEVPLDHPGRDKERGRIWRIVKDGTQAQPPDFKAMDSKSIAAELGNPNLTRRHLALREVKQRGTRDWLPALTQVFEPEEFGANTQFIPRGDRAPEDFEPWETSPRDFSPEKIRWPKSDLRTAFTLWALSYLGERLAISSVMRDLHTGGWWVEDRGDDLSGLVMSQCAQIIGNYEKLHPWEKWNLGIVFDCRGSAAGRAVCQTLLHRLDFLDGDPGWQGFTVGDLMTMLHQMIALEKRDETLPWQRADDTAFILSMKILLRDFLSQPHVFNTALYVNPEIMRDDWFTELLCSVPNSDVSRYLTIHGYEHQQAAMKQIATYGDERSVQKALEDLRHVPVECFAAMQEGFLQRGGPMPKEFIDAAINVMESLLDRASHKDAGWLAIAHPDFPQSDSPWCKDERKTTDGKPVSVISSLDRSKKDAEKLTGILRSKTFSAPKRIVFELCGHRGPPGKKPHEKNVVRLLCEGEVVRQAYPPRNDATVRVEWDTQGFAGKMLQLEIVDGENGTAYAWLAVGNLFAGDSGGTDLGFRAFETDADLQKQIRTLASILRTAAPIGLRDRLAPYLPKPAKLAKARPQPEIDALIQQRIAAFAKAKPDVEVGENVFKMNCAVCHQIKGEGGLIGPQLDGIGNRGPERLIEDILDPNRNVDAHFHLHQMKLRDGSPATGFVRGEVGQVTILVDAAGNEQRISKGDIVEDTDLPQSLMPPTFGQTIPPDAFNDLIGWLLKR
jgi:putative heme-binding domain-containing protein